METSKFPHAPMPDVARETSASLMTPLDWVGMKGIEMPVRVPTAEGSFLQAARIDALVSLDRAASRGIHMSRLFLAVQERFAQEPLSFRALESLTADFLRSHEELSSSARLEVRLQWPLQRAALKSANRAWRTYPVTLSFERRHGEMRAFLETVITYSSTCPASAALARQLVQESFRETFTDADVERETVARWLGTTDGISATPHAQRSEARVKVQALDFALTPERVIDAIEEALQTPVQAAVKREDEQEFARRNGQNLMFCEDAARRVQQALETLAGVGDYFAECSHFESLHPHNAVSVISRGTGLSRSF